MPHEHKILIEPGRMEVQPELKQAQISMLCLEWLLRRGTGRPERLHFAFKLEYVHQTQKESNSVLRYMNNQGILPFLLITLCRKAILYCPFSLVIRCISQSLRWKWYRSKRERQDKPQGAFPVSVSLLTSKTNVEHIGRMFMYQLLNESKNSWFIFVTFTKHTTPSTILSNWCSTFPCPYIFTILRGPSSNKLLKLWVFG